LVPRGTQKSRPCSARHPFSFATPVPCRSRSAGRRGSASSAFGIAIGVELSARPALPVAAQSSKQRRRSFRRLTLRAIAERRPARARRRARWSRHQSPRLARHRRDRTPGSAIAFSGFCARQGSRRASPGRRGLPLPLRLSGYSIVAPSYFGNNAEVAALTLCRSRPVHEVPPRTQSCAKRSAWSGAGV
jgi:hypothetical protein